MANLMAFLTGIMLTGMIYANGALGDATSPYISNVIFHGIGFVVFTTIIFLSKNNKNWPSLKVQLILPGIFGSLTVILNNWIVNVIGISLMVAFGLFGQVITSLMIDQYGLLGKAKVPIGKKQFLGTVVIISGLILMLV